MIGTVKAGGASIPALGLGTWELRDDVCEEAIHVALAAGCRHFDTAAMYGNEIEVGNAVRGSGVPREEIFVTTKVWHDCAAYDDLLRSVDESLARLDIGPADLVLMHWPNPEVPLGETMRALADVKRRGLVRHIGVSNFTIPLMREAVALASEPVVVNQVEYHPWIDQGHVLDECRTLGMALTAYAPLAKGEVFRDAVLVDIGRAHGKTGGQVALRWLIQQEGVIAIPRSAKPDRIRAFFDIGDFTLGDDEMARITALAKPSGRIVDFDFSPRWD